MAPTNLLDFRFESEEERHRIEDLLFDRLGIATLSHHSRTRLLRDVSEVCRATLEGLVGREIDALVRVDASYYFDWRAVGVLDRAFATIWPALPGLYEIMEGGAIFFGPSTVHDDDEPAPLHGRTPPVLEAWFEPHALMVSGILGENEWNTWHAALLDHTRHLPLEAIEDGPVGAPTRPKSGGG